MLNFIGNTIQIVFRVQVPFPESSKAVNKIFNGYEKWVAYLYKNNQSSENLYR